MLSLQLHRNFHPLIIVTLFLNSYYKKGNRKKESKPALDKWWVCQSELDVCFRDLLVFSHFVIFFVILTDSGLSKMLQTEDNQNATR